MGVTVNPFRYALTANSTASAYVAQNSSPNAPSGSGVFDLTKANPGVGTPVNIPSHILIVPFGFHSVPDNKTGAFRVIGYNETVPADLVTDTAIYIPQLLAEITFTLGARTFLDHAATTNFADTIAAVGTAAPADNGIWASLLSPANDTVANYVVHLRGARYIKLEPIVVTATSVNLLWRPFEF